MTTLGELQVGDRFTFPGKRDVYEVTEKMKSSVLYNGTEPATKTKYDQFKTRDAKVRFLRSTKPKEANHDAR